MEPRQMSSPAFDQLDQLHFASSRRGTILATIICLALALGFVLLGGWLLVCGCGALLGAIFTGHGQAIVVLMILGFTCLAVAMGLSAVPIVLMNRRRSQDMVREWEVRQKQLKDN